MDDLSWPEGVKREMRGFPEVWTGVNFFSSLATAMMPPEGPTATLSS